MDKSGMITRPKLRAAYDRICGPTHEAGRRKGSLVYRERVDSAEAFLRTIARLARYRGLTFDQMAERLGY